MKSKFLNAKYALRSLISELTHRDSKPPDRQIYFVHIPKTAGTTFLRVLYESEPHHLIYPNAFEHSIRNGGRYLLPQELMKKEGIRQELARKKWIVGHFSYGHIMNLGGDPQMLTFLRDPFDRTISEIVHLKTHHKNYQNMSIGEIVKHRHKVLGCRSAIAFGYHPTLNNVEKALEHLQACTFIGLTERFSDSLKKCNKILGTNLKVTSRHNEGSKSLIRDVTRDHEDEIRSLIKIDQRFYEEGKKIFETY
ncbi:MAG: sulfotransferase family 2 domain-containing protein [Saprospiraceae bacterium]|nr:sulfotransferase family 2 domain-containing protein [Saprospiraceae bacterium]